MKHKTSTLQTTDGLSLFYQSWQVENPKANIIISHGYAEHSSRYNHLANFLLGQGYSVFALDHRGHGRSEGEKAFINSFAEFVADLDVFVELVKAESAQPVFLLGHSMGGTVAALYALKHAEKLDGLLLSAPFLKNATKVSPILLAMAGFMSRVAPRFPANQLDSDLISRDKTVVAAYDADPLVYSKPTKARFGHEFLKAADEVLANANSITLPLLLMHGSDDQIAHPDGSKELFAKLGSNDKTQKSYEGLYHEILNEPEKMQVVEDINSWLGSHA